MYTFHYHPETKLYTGSEPCEFDALEPGRKVIPAWATDKPVPPMKDGFERVFDEASGYWLYSPVAHAVEEE